VAVVQVTEKWSDRPAEGTWDSRRAQRTFEVLTDNPVDDFTVVGAATDVPAQTAQHPNDAPSRVVRKRIRALGPMLWEVVCEYEGLFPQAGYTVGQSDDPLDYPYEEEWDFIGGSEEVAEDKDGNPLLNAAKERFEGIKTDVWDQVLRITLNVATENWDPALARQYAKYGATNSDTFRGASPGQVKCGPIRAKLTRYRGYTFYRVSCEFYFREDGWKRRVVEEGHRYWDPDAKNKQGDWAPFKDGQFPSARPHLIKHADGTKLDDNADPEYAEFELSPSLSFAALGTAWGAQWLA